MRIVVIGQAAFGKSVVQSLGDAGEDVVAVFCPVDRAGKELDPIKQEALSRAIPVLQFKRMRDDEAVQAFLEIGPDLCVMAFVTDFVPSSILQAPVQGTIQYHPSMLPLHRGPSSINWPIIQGETMTGVSIFWPDDGLDTGPILTQKTAAIGPDDTVGSLYYEKLFPLGVEAITQAVALIRQGIAPKIPQDHESATYESWCGLKEGVIDWSTQGSAIYNLIRGCDPRPGASARVGSHLVHFFDAEYQKETHDVPSGTVTSVGREGFSVAVDGGYILITTVQVEGSRIPAGSWASINLTIGDMFTADTLS